MVLHDPYAFDMRSNDEFSRLNGVATQSTSNHVIPNQFGLREGWCLT